MDKAQRQLDSAVKLTGKRRFDEYVDQQEPADALAPQSHPNEVETTSVAASAATCAESDEFPQEGGPPPKRVKQLIEKFEGVHVSATSTNESKQSHDLNKGNNPNNNLNNNNNNIHINETALSSLAITTTHPPEGKYTENSEPLPNERNEYQYSTDQNPLSRFGNSSTVRSDTSLLEFSKLTVREQDKSEPLVENEERERINADSKTTRKVHFSPTCNVRTFQKHQDVTFQSSRPAPMPALQSKPILCEQSYESASNLQTNRRRGARFGMIAALIIFSLVVVSAWFPPTTPLQHRQDEKQQQGHEQYQRYWTQLFPASPTAMKLSASLKSTIVTFQKGSLSRSEGESSKATTAAPSFAIPPSHYSDESMPPQVASITLRDFLVHPDGLYFALAPSFFGFYGYFGSLAAWEKELSNHTFSFLKEPHIHGLAGASAGAMAAILLAAGVSPMEAASFCATIDLPDFADFPGVWSVFKGDKFESIMENFLKEQVDASQELQPNRPDASNSQIFRCKDDPLQLENSQIPVAVSGFDLQSFQRKLLVRGSMARAARASACFPFLFQPVGWIDGSGENYLLVDGGLNDAYGLEGLAALVGQQQETPPHTSSRPEQQSLPSRPIRIVNIVVGSFHMGVPLGPSEMPHGVNAQEVLSISIQNLPKPGPWAMEKGPFAVEGARIAMAAALDLPLYIGKEPGHFELHIDATTFVPELTAADTS